MPPVTTLDMTGNITTTVRTTIDSGCFDNEVTAYEAVKVESQEDKEQLEDVLVIGKDAESGGDVDDEIDDEIDDNVEDDVDEKEIPLVVFGKKDIFTKPYIGILFATMVQSIVGFLIESAMRYNLIYVRSASVAKLNLAGNLLALVSSLYLFYGLVIDWFPIRGLSWKPYTLLGLILAGIILIILAAIGDNISVDNLIYLSAIAMVGIDFSFTALNGFIPWIHKRESVATKGYTQVVVDGIDTVSALVGFFIIILYFSGPQYTCIGYEENSAVTCTNNTLIMEENPLSKNDTDNWCHTCPDAPVPFDVPLPISYITSFVILLIGFPCLYFLNEDKKEIENIREKIIDIWVALNKRQYWQMILFTLVFSILTGVKNPASSFIPSGLLGLGAINGSISSIIQIVVFIPFLALYLIFGLKFSRRKIMIAYIVLEIIFEQLLDLLMIYDVTRSTLFMYFQEAPTSLFDRFPTMMILITINDIAEPGLETTVHALFSSCAALGAVFASTAISQVLLPMFPSITTKEDLAKDSPEMRTDYAIFNIIVIIIKILAIFTLPMLPRQEVELDALIKKNERSTKWATIATLSYAVMLMFTIITTILGLFPSTSCIMLVGGGGCTTNDSDVPSYLVLIITLAWCLIIPTTMIYWPIFMKGGKFSWQMFV